MAKLTKKQKNLIQVIKYYHAKATKELEAHGVTSKYDAHMWMVVMHSDEIGCDVASFERDAADRYWARTTAAA